MTSTPISEGRRVEIASLEVEGAQGAAMTERRQRFRLVKVGASPPLLALIDGFSRGEELSTEVQSRFHSIRSWRAEAGA